MAADLQAIAQTQLPDSHGEMQRIGDLWKDRPVVLVWLRHYG